MGEIRLNGTLVNTLDDISSVSAYVQQDDLFVGHLTVKEHLIFQVIIIHNNSLYSFKLFWYFFKAMLRMDKNKTKEEKLNRIEQILYDVNFNKNWLLLKNNIFTFL